MANTVKGVLIVKQASDQYQASYEEAVCLASISGDDAGLAIFKFVKDNVFADTVT